MSVRPLPARLPMGAGSLPERHLALVQRLGPSLPVALRAGILAMIQAARPEASK